MNPSNNKNILITRHSTIIIKLMHKLSIPANKILVRIIQRIQKEIRCFESLEFYHVLRVRNKHVDKLANSTYRLAKGALKFKKCLFIEPIHYVYSMVFLIFSMFFIYQLMRKSIVNSHERASMDGLNKVPSHILHVT